MKYYLYTHTHIYKLTCVFICVYMYMKAQKHAQEIYRLFSR